MIKTIQDLKQINPIFFLPENKRFFNDIDYKLLTGKKTKTKFLIQHPYKFSVMFGAERKAVFVVKPITKDGKILSCIIELDTLEKVKQHLEVL